MFSNVVIVSMARTPIGKFGGTLSTLSAIDLGTIVTKTAIERAGISAQEVDEVVFGCVGQYGINAFLARLISLKSGIPEEASAQTVNRMCASGLQAIVTGAMLIEQGFSDVVVAGGSESMSNYPYLLNGARWGFRMGTPSDGLVDALNTALCEPTTGTDTHIAITAESIADQYNITRDELDTYALESQKRAQFAISEGRFKEEIVPVEIVGKKNTIIFDTDEYPRETSIEQLSKLKPFVKVDGKVTAGNASGINDGAAAVVLMSREKALELNIQPLARIVNSSCVGIDPKLMGLGPISSTRALLARQHLSIHDIDIFELNEAFASQAIACIRELELDPNKVNVNGSGISLGHPIGATGAIISIKLISEMLRTNVKNGIASLCIGGGQGMSVLFEREPEV